MASYKSVIQKDKDGNPIKDKFGDCITKSYAVDDEGEIICDMAWEDNPEEVKKRIEVECHKRYLRSGRKLYTLNNDPDSKGFGQRVFAKHQCEEIPGTVDIAEKEYAEEQAALKKVIAESKKVKVKT